MILLGDPASGKDTQADLLMKKYAFQPVESGKQWRMMVKKNDFRGRWLKRTFELGHPAPVAIVKWFLNKRVKDASKNKNIIFIGNPRLKPEAQFLVKLLHEKHRDFFVFYIKLPEGEIYSRVLKRRNQEADTRLRTKRRIEWHKKQVLAKTMKYFLSMHKAKFINGNQSIKKVTQDIQKAINDYTRSSRNRKA